MGASASAIHKTEIEHEEIQNQLEKTRKEHQRVKDALATVRYDQDPKAAGRVALAKATKQGETSLASIKADISHIRKGFAAANAINSKALKELREAQNALNESNAELESAERRHNVQAEMNASMAKKLETEKANTIKYREEAIRLRKEATSKVSSMPNGTTGSYTPAQSRADEMLFGEPEEETQKSSWGSLPHLSSSRSTTTDHENVTELPPWFLPTSANGNATAREVRLAEAAKRGYEQVTGMAPVRV